MKLLQSLCASLLLFSAGNALAQSTQNFKVLLEITESCAFSTLGATDVDFGSVIRSANAADAAGALTVDCTVGSSYKIELNEGTNPLLAGATASANSRRMKHATLGEYVAYGLFRDASRTAPWGLDTNSQALSQTAAAAAESIPVYGRIPASQTNKSAGNYQDTVIATLIF